MVSLRKADFSPVLRYTKACVNFNLLCIIGAYNASLLGENSVGQVKHENSESCIK